MRKKDRSDEALSVTVGYAVNLALAGLMIASAFIILNGALSGIEADVSDKKLTYINGFTFSQMQTIDRQGEGEYSIYLPPEEYSYTVKVNDSKIVTTGNNIEVSMNSSLNKTVDGEIILDGGLNKIKVINNEIQAAT